MSKSPPVETHSPGCRRQLPKPERHALANFGREADVTAFGAMRIIVTRSGHVTCEFGGTTGVVYLRQLCCVPTQVKTNAIVRYPEVLVPKCVNSATSIDTDLKRDNSMSYKTSCHCGAVTIEMQRPIRKMTQCNCSICRRYGALWAYQQRKAVRVIAAKGALKAYTWGKGELEFFHCSKCGCTMHYERSERRADGSDMSAVNMRNIDDPSRISNLPIRLFDGAGTWKVLSEDVEPHLLLSPEPQTVSG